MKHGSLQNFHQVLKINRPKIVNISVWFLTIGIVKTQNLANYGIGTELKMPLYLNELRRCKHCSKNSDHEKQATEFSSKTEGN